MIKIVRKLRLLTTLMLLPVASGFFVSCSSGDEDGKKQPEYPKTPYNITVLLTPGGPGDNGYNDRIVNGIAAYATQQNLDIFLVRPIDIEEAREGYIGWISLNRDVNEPSLLILAGSDYDGLVQTTDTIGTRCCVLLLESARTDLPENALAFRISRYGTSYLAGAMVSGRKAHVIAATAADGMVRESVNGFCDGYEAHSGHPVDSVFYLSDGYQGFSLQAKARHLTDSIGVRLDNASEGLSLDFTQCYNTFFPIAGAANQGVYNGVCNKGMQQAIGMDKDCSDMNDNIPFSVDIAIDKLLLFYLDEWVAGRELPRTAVYGMDSGYINLLFSPTWNSTGNFVQWDFITLDYSKLPDDFWKSKYTQYKEEALEKERAYEKK